MKEVYIIQNLSNGSYKIGTSKHPNKRVKEIQTGNDASLKLVSTYPSEYAIKIEKTLHNLFSHCRREGEWFELSLTEAFSFDEKCKKIETSIDFLKKNGNVFI